MTDELKTKGLLDIESLDRPAIEAMLERARFFQPAPGETYKRLETLKGKTVINLFFEASTRTRVSFEIAARRLGADRDDLRAGRHGGIARRRCRHP